MYKILCVVLFLGWQHFASAQQLKGKIVDENGEPLPFATIYPKGSTDGSSSNIKGEYQLSLTPGTNQVVFQHVGYKRIVYEIEVERNETEYLEVVLSPDIIQLKELVVTGDGKDPAYYTIAQAIKLRKYHLEELKAYQCNVYIKGMQSITKKPNKVMGFKVSIDTGIVYLSESVSEFNFLAPNKIKERMISSRVSGNNRAFSYNQASEMNVNFYENVLSAEGLSERGFISPIAQSALSYYDYKLVGILEEDGYVINKIQVIPKRKGDPVFSGYIYILEDSWRIHSTDLSLGKENQIEFLDNVSIRQVYAPVDFGIWMMLSQKFTFDLSAFGFEGRGTFMAIHSNYKIEPAYPERYQTTPIETQEVEKVIKIPKRKKARESELFPNAKEVFNNAVLTIEEGSNKRDSTYWESIRPIPLTHTEIKDYAEKDSLQVVVSSKPYKDSVDQNLNKISLENILFSGYTYRNTFNGRYFGFDPVLRFLQFNTVEGLVLNTRLRWTQLRDEQLLWRIIPELRYGFASKKFYGQVNSYYYTNLKKFARINLSGGSFISQINSSEPIPYWVNSAYTLLARENYMKIYEEQFVKFGYQQEIVNGIVVSSNASYANRNALENTTEYSLLGESTHTFTSNHPENETLQNTNFEGHRALVFDVLVRLRFRQKYIDRPDQKFLIGSDYPRVNIYYKKGINALGSALNFDLLEITALHDIDFKMLGSATASVVYGNFINNSAMYFPDFKHFNGNRVLVTSFNHGNFQLLDYYRYSTNSSYLSAHYEHHFNGFITNKIPLLKKTKVQTVLTLNYLKTPALPNYYEFGVGFEHIFKFGRVDYFFSRSDTAPNAQGVRLGYGF